MVPHMCVVPAGGTTTSWTTAMLSMQHCWYVASHVGYVTTQLYQYARVCQWLWQTERHLHSPIASLLADTSVGLSAQRFPPQGKAQCYSS